MRTVIVGPGALGCLLATRLHLAGAGRMVALLDHDRRRAAELNRQGIYLADEAGQQRALVPVSADPALVAGAELVLLCVKAPAFAAALERIAPLLPPSSLLLALQNGISHLEILSALDLPCAWGLGVSTEGATLLAPGRVRSGGSGTTHLGFVAPPPSENHRRLLAETAATLNRAGCRCLLSANITRELWRKLIVNTAINALTVIHDCPNGRLLEIPGARQMMAAAAREAAAVAAAAGVDIEAEPLGLVEAVCRQTASNISSMLQDVRRGRPTEIDAINGAVIRLAARYQLPVPVNQELVDRLASP